MHSRSSQLSKNLDSVLRDKDALAYFISFLQSLGADSLVRFWLDVEAFRLAAERTPSVESIHADRPPPAEPIHVTADQTPPSAVRKPIVRSAGSEDQVCCSKTPEGTQQRVPTNYCGHASAGSSPKAVGRLPAHGEVMVSTDSAVPSSSAVPAGLRRPSVDCCPASNPSISAGVHSSQPGAVQQTGLELGSSDNGDSVQTTSSTISSAPSENILEPSHKGFTLSCHYRFNSE